MRVYATDIPSDISKCPFNDNGKCQVSDTECRLINEAECNGLIKLVFNFEEADNE